MTSSGSFDFNFESPSYTSTATENPFTFNVDPTSTDSATFLSGPFNFNEPTSTFDGTGTPTYTSTETGDPFTFNEPTESATSGISAGPALSSLSTGATVGMSLAVLLIVVGGAVGARVLLRRRQRGRWALRGTRELRRATANGKVEGDGEVSEQRNGKEQEKDKARGVGWGEVRMSVPPPTYDAVMGKGSG